MKIVLVEVELIFLLNENSFGWSWKKTHIVEYKYKYIILSIIINGQILQHLANLKSSSSKVSGPLFANLLCQSQTYVLLEALIKVISFSALLRLQNLRFNNERLQQGKIGFLPGRSLLSGWLMPLNYLRPISLSLLF